MENEYKDIELRSEEVQEVMNRIPPAILRYGITTLLCIVVMLFTISALFRYPDTVEAELVLDTQNPPAYIITESGGRIEELYVIPDQEVDPGDALGVIANVAKTEELFYLRERIEEWKRNGCRTEQADILFFRHIPELGSVQEAYAACLIAWNNYLQHMQENRIYETEMTNAIAALGNSVAEWEKKFLLTVPVKGTVAFMQPWKKKQLVEKGETMFVVIPKDTICYVGKALLPMNGIGKVQLGQRTIIRLPAFPEQEFGFIEGKVKSVSPVPNSEGYYVVEILFPNGLLTNHGKELPLIRSLEGTASIVTQEKSLLEKLLNFRL